MGPTSVAASSGAPTFNFLLAATNNSRNLSNTARSTMTRCAEMHCWPLASKAAPAMRRVRQIGIRTNDVRGVGAEFGDEALGACGTREIVAGGGAARERHDTDQR